MVPVGPWCFVDSVLVTRRYYIIKNKSLPFNDCSVALVLTVIVNVIRYSAISGHRWSKSCWKSHNLTILFCSLWQARSALHFTQSHNQVQSLFRFLLYLLVSDKGVKFIPNLNHREWACEFILIWIWLNFTPYILLRSHRNCPLDNHPLVKHLQGLLAKEGSGSQVAMKMMLRFLLIENAEPPKIPQLT